MVATDKSVTACTDAVLIFLYSINPISPKYLPYPSVASVIPS